MSGPNGSARSVSRARVIDDFGPGLSVAMRSVTAVAAVPTGTEE